MPFVDETDGCLEESDEFQSAARTRQITVKSEYTQEQMLPDIASELDQLESHEQILEETLDVKPGIVLRFYRCIFF